MRKLVIITLILSLVLVGCTIRDSDKNTTNTPDLNISETSKDQATHTDPSDSIEGITSGPVTSDSTLPTPTVLDPSENSTEGTEPAGAVGETDSAETQSPQQATELQPPPQHLLRKQTRCRPHLLRQRLHGLLGRRQRRCIKPKK